MLTYKYFVYYPKPRGGYRPITPPPPLARGIYPPLFGAPAQQRDANCINFTCLTKSPHGAILFKFPVLWLAKQFSACEEVCCTELYITMAVLDLWTLSKWFFCWTRGGWIAGIAFRSTNMRGGVEKNYWKVTIVFTKSFILRRCNSLGTLMI